MTDVNQIPVVKKNDTYVRRYKESDIDHLVEHLCKELPQLPQYAGITPKPDKIEFLLRSNINNEGTYFIHVLCDSHTHIPVGGGSGYCLPCLFSDDMHTSDLFLFVHPRWRSLLNVMKLIEAYKEWAKRRGAKIIGSTHTSGYRSDAMDMLLLRAGFDRIGFIYHLKQ